MIWGIPASRIGPHVQRLLPFLQNFADRSHSRWSVPGILDEIASEDVQVWVCNDFQAVALTRVWPEAVSIVACAGSERGEWCEDLEAEIRLWAKSKGKRHLLIDGRPGWSRWLKSLGYQEAHREMVVEL